MRGTPPTFRQLKRDEEAAALEKRVNDASH
jgi:hypothetical protein